MAARDDKPDLNRTETDKSLHQERTKTDGHLERRQRAFEQRTTDSIEEDRRIVDERRILDRASRDRSVTAGHEPSHAGGLEHVRSAIVHVRNSLRVTDLGQDQ